MAYARPSLVEVSKRHQERKINIYHVKGINGTADTDDGNLGEGSNHDESQNGGKDGSHPRRWSPDEDERLRNAVEKHHEANWKEIAAEVGSRNHVQCLQRWKKVLTPGLVKGQWSREEDEVLMSLVSEGHKNWGTLAARIPGRTSKQCRERWCHHLDPRIVKGDWTSEEDQILLSMHEGIGNKWATIAQHLNGRTENATKIRWKILERSLKQEHAGQNIDQVPRGNGGRQVTDGRLRCLATQAAVSVMSKANDSVNPIGIPQNPAAVLDALGGEGPEDLAARDPPQKRRSWEINGKFEDNVSPSDAKDEELGEGGFKKRKLKISKNPSSPSTSANARGESDVEALDTSLEPMESSGTGGGRGERRGWLREEDERLRLGVGKLGDRNWRYVAQIVETRTHVQCQQRWKKALRPGLIKGAWSVEEDENLMRLIGQGFSTWSELASHTPGRSAKQCRERWCHHLDPSVNHGSWTEEEDRQLLTLQDRLGTKWSAIAREMPGRTEHAVKGRVKTLSRSRRVGAAGAVCLSKRKTPPERSELLKQETGPVRIGDMPKVSSLTSRSPVESAANVGLRRPRGFNSGPPSPVPRDDEPCEFEVQDKSDGVQQDEANVKQHGFQHPCAVNLQSGSGEYYTQGTREYLSQYSGRSRDPQNDTLVGLLHGPAVGVEESAGGNMTGGDSIAKLLSISSLGTDSVTALAEDIANPGSGAGSCGGDKRLISNKDNVPREVMSTQISLHQSAPVGTAVMEVLPGRARQDIVPSIILDQSVGDQLASGSLSCQGPRQETVSQMPVLSTGGRNALIPGIREVPNANVSGPSGFDDSVSSNIVTSVPSSVDARAPSASGVSNPVLNILEPLKVSLPGGHNVEIATDPNTGVQGACDVDSCDSPGNSASGEASLSVSRPSEVDFSDLASFLTESANTQQDVVGRQSEGVSIGDDPYSNYYDNAYLIPGITKPFGIPIPEVNIPTGAVGHPVEYNSLQHTKDGWEGSPEDWAIKVLDAVCDPYF